MDIYTIVQDAKPSKYESVNSKLYDNIPYVSKDTWNLLGVQIITREQTNISMVPRDRCFTLRLDIRSMSKLKKVLQRMQVLTAGWNWTFANIMCMVTETLAKEFN